MGSFNLPPATGPEDPRFKDWLNRIQQKAAVEGTWSPVLTFATPGNLSVTYQFQFGDSIIQGSSITLIGMIQTSAFTFTTASGNLWITGIPKDADASRSGFVWTGSASYQGITKASYTQFVPQIGPETNGNNTRIRFLASGSGQSLANVTASDVPSGGTVSLRFQITYRFR